MSFGKEFFEQLPQRVQDYARDKHSGFGPTLRVLTMDGEEAFPVQRIVECQDGWVAFAYFHKTKVVKPEAKDPETYLHPIICVSYETIRSVEFDWSDPKNQMGFSTGSFTERGG